MIEPSATHAASLFFLENKRIGWPGHEVFNALSLNINEGEKIALIGKSGSGKSTLLKHLYQQKASEIAFCEQNLGLVASLSCFHNIYMGQLDRHHFIYNAINLFFPFKAEQEKVAELAKSVGLLDKLKSKAETLSGGQQQRVVLARCLLQKQSIFLGDEPVSALDETQANELLALIMSKHETVIVALHHTQQALKHCDRVIGLQNGQIVLDQPSTNLKQNDLGQFYSDETLSSMDINKASEVARPALSSVG
ncbi:MAG: phosphonate transport system ATP-binding protein [Oleiphilaceae bacterium]|jgi:phosphonate transport system ATP-binding protein